jgi:hypothetical protein
MRKQIQCDASSQYTSTVCILLVNVQMTLRHVMQCMSQVQFVCTANMTLYSAIFASQARLQLAYNTEFFTCDTNRSRIQYIAGAVAETDTLRSAHKLGMPLSTYVLAGSARSDNLVTLQWLHTERQRELPHKITLYAARGGSISTLQWLKEQGCGFDQEAISQAAIGNHLHIIEYLRNLLYCATFQHDFSVPLCARQCQLQVTYLYCWYDARDQYHYYCCR